MEETDEGSEYWDDGAKEDKSPAKPSALLGGDKTAEEQQTPSANNNVDDGDDDDDDMESALSDDIYSMIFTSKAFGGPFLFAIAVFLFQLSITLLILQSLINRDSDNPLGIPPGVTNYVTAAAGLSIILLLAVQEDMVEGMIMLIQGFYMAQNKQFDDITARNPNATAAKWFLASFLQFCAGCALLVTIFILIMQSTSVIGMMLNFAALGFVAEIDNVAFSLAERGFVSMHVQKETENVANFKMKNPSSSNSNTSSRRLLFLAILAGLYAGYGYLVWQQKSGEFLCKSIGVQFGDDYDSFLTPLSGVYDQGDTLVNGKVAYYQRSEPKRAMFAYCKEEESWTFSWSADPSWEFVFYDPNIIGMPNGTERVEKLFIEDDPCNWAAKSPPASDEFDITNTDLSQWQVVNQEIPDGTFYFDHFSMWCADCSNDDSGCDGQGDCVDNKCVCKEGRYGSNCEFDEEDVCPYLALDQREEEGANFPYDWEIYYDSDGNLTELHDRPIYFNEKDIGIDGAILVSTYNGRRWLIGIITKNYLDLLINNSREKKYQGNILQMPIEEYFAAFNNTSLQDALWYYSSVPVDRQTSSYAYTPVGLTYYEIKENTLLGWFNQEPDLNRPWAVPLLCANCTSLDNSCFNYGFCYSSSGEDAKPGEFGVCDCPLGYAGFLCEKDLEETCTDDYGGECPLGGTCILEGDFEGSCNCTGTGHFGDLCQFPLEESR